MRRIRRFPVVQTFPLLLRTTFPTFSDAVSDDVSDVQVDQSTKILLVSSSYLLLFILLFVYTPVRILPACITIYQSYVCVGGSCVEALFRVGTYSSNHI